MLHATLLVRFCSTTLYSALSCSQTSQRLLQCLTFLSLCSQCELSSDISHSSWRDAHGTDSGIKQMKAEMDRSKVVLLPHINTRILVTTTFSISPFLSLTPWAPSCFSPHCHPIASNCHTQMHTLTSSSPTDTHHVAILHALFHMFF